MACSQKSPKSCPSSPEPPGTNLGDNGKQWPILKAVWTPKSCTAELQARLGRSTFSHWEESTELVAQREEFPFILTTGRILEHYNCGTMTRRTGNAQIVTQDELAINPKDARAKNIRTGDRVRLFSARGEVTLPARVTEEVKPGILYTTFHFPEAMVNNVTGSGHDADTLCPEYKVVAADVERVPLGAGKSPSLATA
jgi:formate dehydrogenase major subunit